MKFEKKLQSLTAHFEPLSPSETAVVVESSGKLLAFRWSDVSTLIRCYQQPDDDTMLRVMNEPRKVMERAKSG